MGGITIYVMVADDDAFTRVEVWQVYFVGNRSLAETPPFKEYKD